MEAFYLLSVEKITKIRPDSILCALAVKSEPEHDIGRRSRFCILRSAIVFPNKTSGHIATDFCYFSDRKSPKKSRMHACMHACLL